MDTTNSILSQALRDCLGQVAEPWAIHTDGTCISANEAFATLFGYVRPEDVIDRSMGEFISPWPACEPRLGTRKMMGRRRNGEGMDVEVTCLPFAAGDGVLYQCLIRDISQHKSWEDKLLQSERLTAMGKLSGEIAHEINNPLGGILLYANLLKEDIPEGGQTYANLEKIIRLATRCRIIAKGLLNFGRSSAKTYASVNLNQVIVEMFSMVEDHRILRMVEREMRLSPDLPHIMGDRGQIEQVVLNLVINAGEAMNGEGRLLIETALVENPRTIHFVVEDSGPGIPHELLDKIFDPFFTTKRPGRGTGLGLSITHGIVQRHGGRISVHSTPGQGTRFDVVFPLRENG